QPRGDAAGEIEVGADGWSDEVLERFADRAVEVAGRHIPNLPGAVLGRAIIGPREIAAFNPNSGPGGDPYGGRHDLAQSYLLRPAAGAGDSSARGRGVRCRARPATRRRCRGSTCSAPRPGRATAWAVGRVGSTPGCC